MVGRCGGPGAHARAIMTPPTTRQGPPGGPGGLGGRVAPLVLSDKPSALVEFPSFPGALSSGALLDRASVEAPARSDSCVGDRSGQFLWWSGGGRRGLWRCRRFPGPCTQIWDSAPSGQAVPTCSSLRNAGQGRNPSKVPRGNEEPCLSSWQEALRGPHPHLQDLPAGTSNGVTGRSQGRALQLPLDHHR